MPPRLALATSLLSVLIAGCTFGTGESCSDIALFGLRVLPLDAKTQLGLCGATVVATDGAHTETLEEEPFNGANGDRDGCVYVGAAERPGTYAVDVTVPGYAPFHKDGVVVASGSCHLTQTTVTASLVVD